MTENINLGPKLSPVATFDEFRKTSQNTVNQLKELNPLKDKIDIALFETIQKKQISFQDSLKVIRDTDIMEFPDPQKDNLTSSVTIGLNLFMADSGNAIIQTRVPEKEIQFIIRNGVLNPTLRLPQVIEGVRQIILTIEETGYSEQNGGEKWKKEKIARLSNYLYSLANFQTDLIADELSKATGKNWEEARKSVVEWGEDVSKKLESYAEKNPKLKSLIEKPVFTKKDQIAFSPTDPMFKNKGVKSQKLKE